MTQTSICTPVALYECLLTYRLEESVVTSSRRLMAALALLLVSSALAAQSSHYVTDELRVNLRAGAGTDYRIAERIAAGTGLDVLAERNGWTRVRTEDGTTGWLPSQYLTEEAPAVRRLPDLEDELGQARERILALEAQLRRVRGERDSAHERIEELEAKRQTLETKVKQASRGINLAEENTRLKKDVVELERRVQTLTNQNEALSDQHRQEWFLVGAGVLVAGLVLGLLMGRARAPKRGAWNQI